MAQQPNEQPGDEKEEDKRNKLRAKVAILNDAQGQQAGCGRWDGLDMREEWAHRQFRFDGIHSWRYAAATAIQAEDVVIELHEKEAKDNHFVVFGFKELCSQRYQEVDGIYKHMLATARQAGEDGSEADERGTRLAASLKHEYKNVCYVFFFF